MSNTAVSIITIGDELLIGQTIDTNSAWIAQQLNALGMDVLRRVAVGDERAAMTNALDAELAVADVVIITGGLGPTSDDITKPLLLEYFGGAMRTDERVLQHVKDIFSRRNRPMLDVNLRQADVPDSCTVLFNSRGTAPGMWFERDGKVIVSLPGVPFEMMGIMLDEVLPRLRMRDRKGAIVHYTIVTAGEGESFVAERIADIEGSLPAHIKLAFLPALGMVKLRLTGKGADEDQLHKDILPYRDAIAERLQNIVVSLQDEPLAKALYDVFSARGITLALAESCTGGLIAHQLTQVPGASGYFMGGVVCYSNGAKTDLIGVDADTLATHGAVSEATAKEMATGVQQRLGATYALSATGLLGPASDGSAEPIGTVWMAVAGSGRVEARKFRFFYDRERNKEMAATMGMLLLFRFLKDENNI
ncbi:CinA family nicotinamide mononucleotide deamidase-related protein [Nemorincola caseinilytica]|uniref:CinA-like protein n=1 Tax=Nemorincola caseinilytica TaxID=2054315 RepID=A0ABP8NT56_9BACT